MSIVDRMLDSGVYGAFDNGVRIDHDWLIDKLEWQPEWLMERVRPNTEMALPKP